MSNEQTCMDYALVGLGRGISYKDGSPRHFVEHEGRTVFETDSHYMNFRHGAEIA